MRAVVRRYQPPHNIFPPPVQLYLLMKAMLPVQQREELQVVPYTNKLRPMNEALPFDSFLK